MSGPRRIFLHIGAPKTGTTYLQDRLARNAKTLGQHGVSFPGRGVGTSAPLFHFRAALDLLGQDWGGPPGHAEGSWEALVRRVRRASGDVIISHEILAPAAAEQADRAKRELAGDDAEVHIVYTARDLGRQIPAAWQESVKQGRRWTYRAFTRRVKRRESWFYRSFDLPSVLTTWSAGLPPEQVHVVTVPPRGSGGDLLWERFCAAVGMDPAWAPEESTRRNPSLGAAETTVLRRLNAELGRTARRTREFDELVRSYLAEHELVGRDSRPVPLPPGMYEWAAAETERWIEWVEASRVQVVGDVADLRFAPTERGPRKGWGNPDKVAKAEQLDAALVALAAMTREAARRPHPTEQLVARVVDGVRRLRDQ